jgi:DNA-3-methyladenine glycosylase II
VSAFSISPRGPFSLAAAAEFLSGFPPADRPDAAEGPELTLAFLRDDFSGAAAVTLHERDGEIAGEGDDAVRAQAARMPVIGALMAEHPGLRPVLYPSPYEAAAWAIISARIRGAQAVAVRRRLMEEHGEPAGGLPTFPPPQRLLELTEVRGLTGEKVVRLHAVAEAALEGVLDAEALRALDADEARERLRAIRGIGPFLAELVLLRGAGAPDVLPAAAPRIRAAVAAAYGMAEPPDDARLGEISDAWRPYRGWVCLLLRASE